MDGSLDDSRQLDEVHLRHAGSEIQPQAHHRRSSPRERVVKVQRVQAVIGVGQIQHSHANLGAATREAGETTAPDPAARFYQVEQKP